jgi:hypothetical protein
LLQNETVERRGTGLFPEGKGEAGRERVAPRGGPPNAGSSRCIVAAYPHPLHCTSLQVQRVAVQRCNDATRRFLPGPAGAGQPGWLSRTSPGLNQAGGESPLFADRPGSPQVLCGTALAQSTGVCWAPSSTWIALRGAHTQILLTRAPGRDRQLSSRFCRRWAGKRRAYLAGMAGNAATTTQRGAPTLPPTTNSPAAGKATACPNVCGAPVSSAPGPTTRSPSIAVADTGSWALRSAGRSSPTSPNMLPGRRSADQRAGSCRCCRGTSRI